MSVYFRNACPFSPEYAVNAEYDKLEEEFVLASKIIQLRKDKNITKKELSEKIGTSQTAIAPLESGS